ncbi:MAG TPA: methyl-accepting chemotaxis protein [Terriglobales bacterium]|nr:methyl-accepting chemotaxis protein [Terriglobales bacterium]
MNWFKNLKTVAKLILAFCVVCVLMTVVGYEGISSASTLDTLIDNLYEREMLGLGHVKQAGLDRANVEEDARAAILTSDKAVMEQKGREVEEDFSALKDDLAKAEKTVASDEDKAELAKVREVLPQYENAMNQVVQYAIVDDDKNATATLEKAAATAKQMEQALNDMSDTKAKIGKQEYDQAEAVYEHVRTLLIGIVCFAVLFSIGVGYLIAQLIANPLRQTVGVLEKVADGDMTARLEIETRDEVGTMANALNRATEAIRVALSEVRSSADSMAGSAQGLASSSSQLSAAVQQLASGAQEQASSLEETTATMEQITSTVKQNADNAKQANQVANNSRDTAEKGGQVVTETVGAMGEINEASKNIAEIITTIDEIAFQTNLLALNAAVEAARAGEQGRGFAVVAGEVRNLAQRSAASAKEIKRLIQDSVRKVENGSGLVNKSGETLREIVASVKRVNDIVAEISAASHEQSVGVEQVNKAMIQMDQVTQNNSSQTEELSATAEALSSTAQSLSSHAQQLQGLVGRFRVDEGGARQSMAAPSPAKRAVARTSPKPPRTPKAASRPAAEHAAAAAVAAGAGVSTASPQAAAQSGEGESFDEF